MIVWAYLTVCMMLGFFKVPKMKSLKDYALGPTQFSGTALAISMIAAIVGPGDTIGSVEKSFSLGMVFVVTAFLQLVRWWLMGVIIAPSLRVLQFNGCMTLVDIMKLFYGKWGKYICTANIIFCIAILSIFYKASAFILEKYLNIPFLHGAALITIAITIYSIFGGIHAIIITDVVQFFIFMIVIPGVFFLGFQSIDIPATWSNIPYEKTHIATSDIPLLLSFCIYTIIPVTGFPYIQRMLMARTEKQLKTIMTTTGVFSSLFILMMGIIGLFVSGMNPEIQSDDALFFFIDQVVPSSVMGFVAISFLAVIMSTASSFLNASTVVIIKDIITPAFPKLNDNKTQMMLTKFAGVIVAISSFGIMFVKDHIIDMLWTLDNFWDPFVSVPLIMALLGVRIKHENFKYVLIAALAGVLISRAFHGEFDTITLVFGVASSISAMLFFRDKSIKKYDIVTDFNDEQMQKVATQS
jgi:SSS family solute:Na+ symporter